MTQNNDNKFVQYDVKIHVSDTGFSLMVHVYARNHIAIEEKNEFDLSPAGYGKHPEEFKKNVCRFIAGALRRISTACKQNLKSVDIFSLTISQDPITKANAVFIEDDNSIEEIFGSKVLLMNMVSNELEATYAAENPGDTTSFSKFYLIDNRAISFKNDAMPQIKIDDFLKTIEELVSIKNDKDSDDNLNDDPIARKLSELLEEASVNKIFASMLLEAKKKTQNGYNLSKEEMVKIITDIKAYALKHNLGPTKEKMANIKKRYETISQFIKITATKKPSSLVPLSHNISKVEINVINAFKHMPESENYAERFDNLTTMASSIMGYITRQLIEKGILKTLDENPNAEPVCIQVNCGEKIVDYIKENNLSIEETFYLGYMVNLVMFDVAKVAFTNEEL